MSQHAAQSLSQRMLDAIRALKRPGFVVIVDPASGYLFRIAKGKERVPVTAGTVFALVRRGIVESYHVGLYARPRYRLTRYGRSIRA